MKQCVYVVLGPELKFVVPHLRYLLDKVTAYLLGNTGHHIGVLAP